MLSQQRALLFSQRAQGGGSHVLPSSRPFKARLFLPSCLCLAPACLKSGEACAKCVPRRRAGEMPRQQVETFNTLYLPSFHVATPLNERQCVNGKVHHATAPPKPIRRATPQTLASLTALTTAPQMSSRQSSRLSRHPASPPQRWMVGMGWGSYGAPVCACRIVGSCGGKMGWGGGRK